MTCCLAYDRQFQFRKTRQSGKDCYKKYTPWYALYCSYTRTRCKRAQNRLQRHTSPEETRCQSSQHTFFLRGQPNRKLRDIQLGPFTVVEQIRKHSYRLKLPTTIRLHPVFHVNNLRPCSTDPLRPVDPVIVPEGDDEEFDVSHISVVCIKSLPRRRGKYLLFMTHFSDDDIPPIWHRLNEVHRTTTLQDFLETPQWHKFAKTQAYIDFMHAYPTRIPESK
jgi:hypothetical protein